MNQLVFLKRERAQTPRVREIEKSNAIRHWLFFLSLKLLTSTEKWCDLYAFACHLAQWTIRNNQINTCYNKSFRLTDRTEPCKLLSIFLSLSKNWYPFFWNTKQLKKGGDFSNWCGSWHIYHVKVTFVMCNN